jgi:hypothetical protein
MFRNLAIAIVSVCAVSTGSPAWSQNKQDQPPSDGKQSAPSDLEGNCRKNQTVIDGQSYCRGEEARLLFKKLGDSRNPTTETVGKGFKKWLQRENSNAICWTREDGGGDYIVSMTYACTVH